MRGTTKRLLQYYLHQLSLEGKALEIGGHSLGTSASPIFEEAGLEYFDLNMVPSDIPKTIVADITDCKEIEDHSFDVIFSSDVFEHITMPWKAAKEICRLLKPGGIAITVTLWSWRNHPCPIDYWRYSPECLEFLFNDLHCLEKGYDLSQRRHDQSGFWKTGMDSVPVDELGGWREHWAVYYVGAKGDTIKPPPTPFKATSDPAARFLRMDSQGRITRLEPRSLGSARARFCPNCGIHLVPRNCVSCKATLTPGARFCAQCGSADPKSEATAQ